MADLSFDVRVTVPNILTIEIEAIPKFVQSKNPVILPPLRSPVLGQPATATAPATLGGQEQLMSRAWGIDWATPMTNRLNALGGATNLQLLGFQAPSLDTDDMAWFATGTMDALTDPITITAPITGASIYGRTFSVGDYVIWDDPRNVNGRYQYEIDQITAVNGQVFTLSRSQQGGRPGISYFGAVRTDHAAINFYRLLNPTFYVLWDGTKQVFSFIWPKMIVSAVDAKTQGVITESLVNLFPIPPTAAAMGLAT
jgi:hypothetical protein